MATKIHIVQGKKVKLDPLRMMAGKLINFKPNS